MSQSDLESLPPELARLLATEKTRPDPPADMQARVLERLSGELLDFPHPTAPGVPASASPPNATPLLLRRLPLALTMLAIGGLGGAVLHAYLSNPLPTTIYVPVPTPPAPLPIPKPMAPTGPVEPAPPVKLEQRRKPAQGRSTPVPDVPANQPPAAGEIDGQLARDRALGAERALIEQARTALARGKAADALVLLGQHARAFGQGQLVEEREALEILSLTASGQMALARMRATAFRSAYPKSMLLRSIDAALVGDP